MNERNIWQNYIDAKNGKIPFTDKIIKRASKLLDVNFKVLDQKLIDYDFASDMNTWELLCEYKGERTLSEINMSADLPQKDADIILADLALEAAIISEQERPIKDRRLAIDRYLASTKDIAILAMLRQGLARTGMLLSGYSDIWICDCFVNLGSRQHSIRVNQCLDCELYQPRIDGSIIDDL